MSQSKLVPVTKQGRLSDLTPDLRNANHGTPRGVGMLEDSLRAYGAGRSVLVDKHGTVIAGNKTVEAAASAGFEDVIVVPTDGRTLVVVQRTDLDLEHDASAKALGVADNRVAEVGLQWDADVLHQLMTEGANLETLFSEQELAKLVQAFAVSEIEPSTLQDGDRAPFQQMTFTLHDEQVDEVREALAKAKADGYGESSVNENSNANALAWICGRFLRG